ncbi:MAG: HAD family hydrolase [Lysobacterales bacterium]
MPAPDSSVIRALSLDLDDTLWPVLPSILAAEHELQLWLAVHCPQVSERFNAEQLGALRERIALEHPELAHDYSAQRRLTLAAAIGAHPRQAQLVEQAYAVFFEARNRVELYPDSAPALARLGRQLPLISLSNGNADLARIGLAQHFVACLSARELGAAKPAAEVFHAVLEQLGLPASAVAHVGDDPLLDVQGARRAGLFAVWLNRDNRAWPLAEAKPDLEVHDLHQLCDWLEQAHPHQHRSQARSP